jgi:TRAP-type C4-dicarboxylate transport system permease small subunit
VTATGNPFLDFTDAHLAAAMRRALRTVAILACVLFSLFTFAYGWQTGAMLLAGALISFTGIWEWQKLLTAINARLDNQQAPKPMGRTLVLFFLRLGIVGAVLYATLRYLQGSVYALVAGLALAVVALTIEAIRLLRG